jgi:ABC-type proline/glycine betaine transport system permease subunit
VIFEQLDTLRGYCIAAVILSIVAIGLSFSLIPARAAWAQRLVRGGAGLIGGIASLAVFFLFSFITGWEEYFATKSAVRNTIEYRGQHKAVARVILTLGEGEKE